MGQVAVTIAGRVYRMACADGEEGHLEGLAADLDKRIADLRVAFGEIGDQRLTVMAALAISDEKMESERRIAVLESQVQELLAESDSASKLRDDYSTRAAEVVTEAAERVERIVQRLNAQGRGA
jgi:cell division protein ZapA